MIIDDREGALIKTLASFGYDKFKIDRLKLADIIIGEILFERKAGKDFEYSMFDGRFNQFYQLADLAVKKGLNAVLILEDFKHDEEFNHFIVSELSMLMNSGISIIFTENIQTTAYFLISVEKTRYTKDIKIRIRKPKGESIKIFLGIIPGIGKVRSEKILKKYRSLKSLLVQLLNPKLRRKNEPLTKEEAIIAKFLDG